MCGGAVEQFQEIGEYQMRTFLKVIAALAVVVVVGCSESTSRKDVASARDKLQKEQQQTADAVNQGQRDVADAQQRAEQRTVAKPVTPDQPTTDQRKVADAQVNAEQKI